MTDLELTMTDLGRDMTKMELTMTDLESNYDKNGANYDILIVVSYFVG